MAFTYNAIEEFNKIKLNELLYDDKLNLYLYQQYNDHIGIKQLFKYFDKKIKDYKKWIYVWLSYRSNQQLTLSDTSQIYFTYFQKAFLNMPEVFGAAKNKYRWDQTTPPIQWNEANVRWDAIESTGLMDVNKTKAIFRFLWNITQKQFTIENFLDFCESFLYLAEDLQVYILDSSFVNPGEIRVYYTKNSEEVVELQKIINTFEPYMPMQTIKLELRARNTRGRRSAKKVEETPIEGKR